MIECIFTIDYEIYGNGGGSLKELVLDPAEELKKVFSRWEAKFMPFVEVAELEMIDKHKTDPSIGRVNEQIREFNRLGFELGLHLHPQWYSAQFDGNRWNLEYSEYNLCVLPRETVAVFLGRAIAYLRRILGDEGYTPISFRAGNGLFQPSKVVAELLAENGVKIDSSVLKGNIQRNYGMDYRRSLQNGYFWRFADDVNLPDSAGKIIELPTFTTMVPFWKMVTSKRFKYQKRVPSTFQNTKQKARRYLDFFRMKYPQKFDFCRMNIGELINVIYKVLAEDDRDPEVYRPIVAIGHTKELADIHTVEEFLSFLFSKGIEISTFGMAFNNKRFGD
jgi:hypothetical protein